MLVSPAQQRKGFIVLFLTEMWERFGFYTVASILVLYLTKALGYSDTHAYSIFAVFLALLYITPLIGGYLADKHLGYKRTLLIGVITLAIGYMFLAIPGTKFLYIGLSLVIIGNGFFKSMPYALLGKLYQHNTDKIDGKFTLYYLSINIGGIPAVMLSGIIAKHVGWNAAFAVAAVGLVLATLTFATAQHVFARIGTKTDNTQPPLWIYPAILLGIVIVTVITVWLLQHNKVADNLSYLISAAALVYLFFVARAFSREEQLKLLGAVILVFWGAIFFILYYQQPTSLTLFVDRNVDHQFLGMLLPSSVFWIFNPIWIILLGPLLNHAYRHLHLSIAMKFGIGLLCMSAGYFIIAGATYTADAHGHVSSWWIVGSYFFQSLAELLISALGTAMIATWVPKKIIGVMMGVWFFASTVAGILAGKLASATAVPAHTTDPFISLHIYQHAFFYFGVATVIIGVFACLCAPGVMRLGRGGVRA